MRIYGMIQNSFDLLGMEMKQELKEKDIEKMIEAHDLRAMTLMTSYVMSLWEVGFRVTEGKQAHDFLDNDDTWWKHPNPDGWGDVAFGLWHCGGSP